MLLWDAAKERASKCCIPFLLRGSRQECSARCHRLGAPTFPALFWGRWVHALSVCLFAGGSRKPVPAPSCSPGQLWHWSMGCAWRATTWLTLLSPQPPALFESLLWVPVSAPPSSSSPGWFYTSVVTREARGRSFKLGSWRQLSQAKALPFCLFASGCSLSLTAQ